MDNFTNLSRYKNPHADEVFLALESIPNQNLNQSLTDILGRYQELLEQEGLDENSEVFLRFHLSDVANHAPYLWGRLPDMEDRSFVSLIGQPPARGGKIALEAYHIDGKREGFFKKKVSPNVLEVNHGEYCSQWIKTRPAQKGPSYRQTQQAFADLASAISPYGGQLRDNVIRTWIYVRDIDNNYQGMVDARRELFEIIGLTKGTHYIASTGIEGVGEEVSNLVLMDALSITGLNPDQVTFMNAPDYLCPTYEYNVTFERATRVTYGDRSHYYVSGTASIDNEGNILHVGNVEKQTERTLVNVEALLGRYGAELADLKILIVYLRDIADAPLVTQLLNNILPRKIPWIMVRGAVCRPKWLIEMEGIAISDFKNHFYAPFCHKM